MKAKNNKIIIGVTATLFTLLGIGSAAVSLHHTSVEVKDNYKPYNYDDYHNDEYDYQAETVAIIIDGNTAKIVSLDEMVVGRLDEESDTLILFTQDGDVITTDTTQISIITKDTFEEAYETACELVGAECVEDMIHKTADAQLVLAK